MTFANRKGLPAPQPACPLSNCSLPATTLSYLSSRPPGRDLQFISPATNPSWKRRPPPSVILRACDFSSMERPPAPQAGLSRGQLFSPCNRPLLFVIPSVPGFPTSQLLPATAYVVLLKENHMQLIEAATLNRKSGEAEGPADPFTSNQSQLEAPPSPSSSCMPGQAG